MKNREVILLDEKRNEIKTLPSASEVARRFNIGHATVIYWIRNGLFRNRFYYKFADGCDCYKKQPSKKEYKEVQDVLDREKYTIIKYEVRNLRESITDCPFKEAPKPKVGGCMCMKCTSFEGRDRFTHEVACSRKYM